VPFLAHGRTFYVGLGTIASDLVVILVVTGIARGRFASSRPWTWRAIHATAYLCWLLSLLHGLLAGRTAKPYVDWSYGACVAAVGLALLVRLVASVRDRRETAPYPVPDRASAPVPAAMTAAGPMNFAGRFTAVPHAPTMPRALPPGAAGNPAEHPVPEPALGELPTQQPWAQEPLARHPAADEQPPYSPPVQPQAPYAETYADDSYADQPYAGAPYPDDPYPQLPYGGASYGNDPYSGEPYAGDPYPGEPYPGDPYPGEPYPGDPYSGEPYGDDPYASAAYPERSYTADPYGELPYPETPYPQDLHPDHPSWPGNGMAGETPAFWPAPDAERL
jgi:hypothetical protein